MEKLEREFIFVWQVPRNPFAIDRPLAKCLNEAFIQSGKDFTSLLKTWFTHSSGLLP